MHRHTDVRAAYRLAFCRDRMTLLKQRALLSSEFLIYASRVLCVQIDFTRNTLASSEPVLGSERYREIF